MNPLNEGVGVNCKGLLLIFLVLIPIEFLAYTDFIDPLKVLADGSEMTDFAVWMWKFVAVTMLEVFLAIFYSVLFDDNAGQELVVWTILTISVLASYVIVNVQMNLSDWMGLNDNTLWIRQLIVVVVCFVAIVGGRRGSSHRSGYQNVSN